MFITVRLNCRHLGLLPPRIWEQDVLCMTWRDLERVIKEKETVAHCCALANPKIASNMVKNMFQFVSFNTFFLNETQRLHFCC